MSPAPTSVELNSTIKAQETAFVVYLWELLHASIFRDDLSITITVTTKPEGLRAETTDGSLQRAGPASQSGTAGHEKHQTSPNNDMAEVTLRYSQECTNTRYHREQSDLKTILHYSIIPVHSY